MQNKDLIKSPLNYTGGKFKLLPQILPIFPKEIDIFYDIFCGGCDVSINCNAKKVESSDINKNIIELYTYVKNAEYNSIVSELLSIIDYYGFSETQNKGYEYYKTNSSDGVGNYNKLPYKNIKYDYNSKTQTMYNRNLMFYILVVFGFNNQIRFNKKGEYNIPVGKRDFNKKIATNFCLFYNNLLNKDISFECVNYMDVDIKESPNSFVYVDPPYLITNATYNESGGWSSQKESELLLFLRGIHDKKILFALSNVIEHKNKKNELLEDWIKDNGFNLHELKFSYNNSSYQKKIDVATREVLVTNY